eukprot:c26396_g1_i4 orf=112-948(+)
MGELFFQHMFAMATLSAAAAAHSLTLPPLNHVRLGALALPPLSNVGHVACSSSSLGSRFGTIRQRWAGCGRPAFPVAVRSRWRWDDDDDEEVALADRDADFGVGVEFFNRGDYYQCHDVLERLWNKAQEPQRTLLHGILQCSVGLYHLLNQNHRGAMLELGEGLSKLQRKMFISGPFHDFQQDIAMLLEYLYSTQLEHAACDNNKCTTMDGSDHSYDLLGNFGAGQKLYDVQRNDDQLFISFISAERLSSDGGVPVPAAVKVKVPVLCATEEDLQMLA